MTRLIAILAAGWALAGVLAAQDPRGEISGRVTDPSGAVVAGAKVAAVSVDTTQVTRTTTNSAGDYLLPFLNAGEYMVSVESAGFRTYRETKVIVRTGESTVVDVGLVVGSASHSVQVVANASTLEVVTRDPAPIADSETIQVLPFRDGNPVLLALLEPGVADVADLSGGATSRPYENENASAIVVNGSSSGTHEYKIDGAANTGGSSGNVAYVPPSGTVSEVKVEASLVDARIGFSSGATQSMGLRAGTNVPHGQLYGYLENPATNANSFFSNKSGTHDNVREVRYGANASGPLEIPHIYEGRNRTFWMYGFEAIRAAQPVGANNLSYTVPSASERQGNFADLLAYGSSYQIYDPATTKASTTSGVYARTAFPGNLIPTSRLSPAALDIIAAYYPLPNLPGAKPTGTDYSVPSVQSNTFYNQTLRLDHVIGEKHRLFFRANLNQRDQATQERFAGGAGNDGSRDNLGLGIDDAYIIGATFLADVRYSFTRYVDNYQPPTAGLDLTTLGFSQNYVNQICAIDPRNLMLPDITPTGYPELNGQAMTRLASDIHAWGLDFTRTAAKHTVRFGSEYRVYRDASANTGRSAGKLDFNTTWTLGPLSTSAASPIGEGLASFLLGLPTDGSFDVNPSLAQQYQVSGSYVQDTWKVGPRLTVNVGVRWEYEIPLTERYNRSVRDFDPNAFLSIATAVQTAYAKNPIAQIPKNAFAVSGGLTFAGVGGQPRTLWDSDTRNFAPRAGVAWLVHANTVLRASGGLFYDIARQNAIQTGFSKSTTLVASTNGGQTFQDSLDNPFPGGISLPTGSSLGAMTNLGQSISVFPARLRNPYMERWEVSLQRELGNSQAIFQVAYVGSRGTRLRVSPQLDPIPARYLSTSPFYNSAVYNALTTAVANPFYPLLPGTSLSGSTVATSQLLRPYPQFTGIGGISNGGFSWYHSLQAVLQKRFSGSYFVTVAYTWSKYMEAIAFLNATDPVPYRVISSQDRPQRLAASFTYMIPAARHGRGFPGALTRGWQVQAIWQDQSGAPLNFGDVLYLGGTIALPAGQRTIAHWFNTSVFDRGTATQLVDNIRTFPLRISNARSMGLDQLDLGAIRTVPLGERLRMSFRADAFNALNHTEFSAPNTSPTSTDFGTITSTARLPRVIEFSARLQF
jgi:hypothetical protein